MRDTVQSLGELGVLERKPKRERVRACGRV